MKIVTMQILKIYLHNLLKKIKMGGSSIFQKDFSRENTIENANLVDHTIPVEEPLSQNIEPNPAHIEPGLLENVEPVIDPQLRRSNRPRKPTFGPDSDYMIFLQEVDDLIDGADPISFKQAQ